MLPNETVENTQSMRLTLKDISTVAKDFVSVIKLLTIWKSDTVTTGSIIVFCWRATCPPHHHPPNTRLLWFIIFIFRFLKQHFLLVAHPLQKFNFCKRTTKQLIIIMENLLQHHANDSQAQHNMKINCLMLLYGGTLQSSQEQKPESLWKRHCPFVVRSRVHPWRNTNKHTPLMHSRKHSMLILRSA